MAKLIWSPGKMGGNKRRSQGENWITEEREHVQRKWTALAWSCDTDGPPQQIPYL